MRRVVFSCLTSAAALIAPPASANYAVCQAYSQKARHPGPIVTAVRETRSNDAAAIRYAFVAYLRSTYAPYGNNWAFAESGAQCWVFRDRLAAENQLALVIGPTRQAGGEIFWVSFAPPG